MEKHLFKEIDGELHGYTNPKWKEYQQKKQYLYFLRDSKIPKDYWDIEFSHYKGTKSLDSLKKSIQYSERCLESKFHNINLYLYGEWSSQKTMAMCNIGKEFIKQGLSVKFVLAGDLIDLLMKNQGYSNNAEIYSDIQSYQKVDLLLIDDIFDKQKSIMWKSENKDLIITEWDRFLRHRISNDRRTVTTSNIRLSVVASTFGRSIYELFHRNFEELEFLDSIKVERKSRFDNLWGVLSDR